METAKLKKFAQFARRSLLEQVSAKLKLVLAENSAARRERAEAIKKLEEAIKGHGKEQVIERVAYIWFNRFCALRFMDVNRYTRIGVVSPAEGQFQPEILAEAKMGHIDEEMVHDKVRQQIFALLDGKAPSRDPQGEAYRLLVVAACNFWNKAMPFLFQRIDDYTELLMPDDLLSGNSILAYTREAMTPDACEDVEVIGWLYQFYISEKKDEVFDGLKKNKKITPENIPAATQLFTPHWIVRYLVENSLGRLWMQNRPNSRLKERMEYYIEPAEEEPRIDTNKHESKENIRVNSCSLVVQTPEEIKICDPACGSGHMLTYAFDLLYAIYEEEGYDPAEIPEKILTHNLYGIEIDERAGELAAFALTMKARAKQRRFFNKGVKPNICVLENLDLTAKDAKSAKKDLFGTTNGHEETRIINTMVKAGVDRDALVHDLNLFQEADNFGSLLRPRLNSEQAQKALEALIVYDQSVQAPTFEHRELVINASKALRQADYLSPKYHVVIANPPYMGGKGMNGRLKAFLQEHYPEYKSDLFSAFVVRCSELGTARSDIGIMSPNVWMYLTSHERLRMFLTEDRALYSLVELPLTGFKGATVQICAYNFSNKRSPSLQGGYIRLVDFKGADEEMSALTKKAIADNNCGWFHRASADDFGKIPGSPIAYWISDTVRAAFSESEHFGEYISPAVGQNTGDNDRFLRVWSEVSMRRIGLGFTELVDASKSNQKWFPYNKGGPYRKWYGNIFYVLNWESDGKEIKEYAVERNQGKHWSRYIQNLHFMLREGVSWTATSSSYFGCRYTEPGFFFDVKGTSGFSDVLKPKVMAAYLGSKVVSSFLKFLNPTIEFQTRDIRNLPYTPELKNNICIEILAEKCIGASKTDWDAYETSWDFTRLPLLNPDYRQPTLKATYQKLRAHWREMTLEMQRLEEENNRIFIDAYGLQDELTPEVPLNEITLTRNPHYRYGNDKSEDELEALLLADTMRELVSYAVGCMFGRYALDKPGLILANQGETIEDYYRILNRETHEKRENEENNFSDFSAFRGSISFPADEDNVIPLLDGDWFTDDISERFKKFLKVAFGSDHYEENLRFVEDALGKDIRKYFLKDFYTDHLKRYKKRPIYWLFSSPKGSFNALIYMHRYRPDTVSVVLNDYLREFRTKLTSHKNHLEAVSISASSSQGEKTKALKEIEKVTKMIAEMEEYEREVLYPLATEQVEIDLDDGVKVNYPKFGAALKKIPGLDEKED